jgi:hypothetical protein
MLASTRVRDAYTPIRDTGRRTHGRTKQRPACWPPFNAMPGQGPKGMGSYQGWVTSALTHPRPSIVSAARNPSRKTALTEPGRQRTPAALPPEPTGDHGDRGTPAVSGHGWRAAPSPQETRRRSALDASRTAPGQSDAGSGAPARTRPATTPGNPERKASPPQSQAPPGKTPGQAGSTRRRSQGRVRNTRLANRTLATKQVRNTPQTASGPVFE